MKKFLLLFCLVAISLSSCSSDDDSNSNEPRVQGEWKIDVLKMEGNLINRDGFGAILTAHAINLTDSDRVIFKDDYSYLSSSNRLDVKITVKFMGNESSEIVELDSFGNGTWAKNGGSLILTSNGESTSYTIDFLSDSTLILSSSEEMTVSLDDEMEDFHGTVRQYITLLR